MTYLFKGFINRVLYIYIYRERERERERLFVQQTAYHSSRGRFLSNSLCRQPWRESIPVAKARPLVWPRAHLITNILLGKIRMPLGNST